MSVIKVVELVGESNESWEKAAEAAVLTASKTLRNISGVEVLNWTGSVKNGKIVDYKTNVKIAFRVEPDDA